MFEPFPEELGAYRNPGRELEDEEIVSMNGCEVIYLYESEHLPPHMRWALTGTATVLSIIVFFLVTSTILHAMEKLPNIFMIIAFVIIEGMFDS